MLTKDKIVKVVIEYIKQGIDVNQISLAEIAKKANIGKSTVYEYFENKNTLICDTYMYLLNYYQEQILKPLTKKTYKKAFKEQVKRLLDAMKDAKHLMERIMSQQNGVSVLDNQSIDEKIIFISKLLEDRFIEILKIGVIENVISSDLKEDTSRGYVIQAIITGLSFQYINNQTHLDEEGILNLIYLEVIRVLQD